MKRISRRMNGLLPLIALVCFGLVLGGCFSPVQELPFEPISECVECLDSDYEPREPALVVVSEKAGLESLPKFVPIYGMDLDKALNETDFSIYYLLVAFHGYEATGGYGIEILSIQRSGKRIEVRAQFTSPQSGATLGVTSPFYVVRIKRTGFQPGKYTFVLVDDSSGKEVARQVTILQ